MQNSRMSERVPAIKVVLLPKDTNAYGTIFGGVILSHIDLASAVQARTVAPHRYVTKAMREVEAERWGATSSGGRAIGERIKVTQAEVVLVAVDAEGRPVPIRPEGLTV